MLVLHISCFTVLRICLSLTWVVLHLLRGVCVAVARGVGSLAVPGRSVTDVVRVVGDEDAEEDDEDDLEDDHGRDVAVAAPVLAGLHSGERYLVPHGRGGGDAQTAQPKNEA